MVIYLSPIIANLNWELPYEKELSSSSVTSTALLNSILDNIIKKCNIFFILKNIFKLLKFNNIFVC